MSIDLTFDTAGGRFNYRAGAIIINDGKLLMAKGAGSPYFYSVGGRVKLNESSETAVLREAKEETGIDFEIERLGFICENFFIEEVSKIRFHEISFFYYLKPLDDANKIGKINLQYVGEGLDGKNFSAQLHWLPLESLKDEYLHPEFFKTELLKGNNGIQHIVINQIK